VRFTVRANQVYANELLEFRGSQGTSQLRGVCQMLSLQIIPRETVDAYRLLRDKVTHEAKTWSWKNKAKTRLIHKQNPNGYIEVGSADGIVVAEIHPADENDAYFFAEKFIGRLVAWFRSDLTAINIQFRDTPVQLSHHKKRSRS